MMNYLREWLDYISSIQFMPHGYCYHWIPALVSLHVVSDGTIALSYMIIPFVLAYFVSQRRDIPFGWMFLCFSMFIVSCGTTHLMEIWTLWHADYWASGFIKAFTAIVSFTTAILLIRLVPTALKLPSPMQIKEINRQLQHKQTQLEQQNILLEKSNELKNRFLANMSHELRTPLNSIIGFSEILIDELISPVTSVQKEYLNYVLSSAHHLLYLIGDLLDIEKIESGRLTFESVLVDVNKLIDKMKQSFEAMLLDKNLKINVNIAPEVSEVILDENRLRQVFYNYISNAIKYSHDNDKININVRLEQPGFLRLEVEDFGLGIKEEDFDKLFIYFQQLNTGMVKKIRGSGLGLSLTRQIVEAQGGKVGVESRYEQGSTFFAILPFKQK